MPIPCPHFKITIVKRSQGQSAVAGAAYQSGERLFSEYDQKTKFYNKKKELVHAEIMLPSYAPPGFADRQILWNAVEAVENQWNSQLARRIVLAFPVEVPKEQYLSMIKEFCQEQFVSKGMIADFAIHDKGDGNPHAHILLTLRAMDEHGKWLPKARKVYDLDENGERIRLASGNWKCHKENTVDWNDQKYAEVWRHSWEVVTNRYLEAAGRPERVDLRSFERQGIQQIPTVHLGPAAHQMEKRGVKTFLGNLNRDIRAANSLMQSIRSAIRGLQHWIADLNEKKQLLLDALEKAKEPTLSDLLVDYFNLRNEQRSDWSGKAKLKCTIENALRRGSNVEGSKLRIWKIYQLQPDRKLRAKALAKKYAPYGPGGSSHTYLDGSSGWLDHDSKGLTFEHYPDHQKVLLRWDRVEKYIDLMIQSDRYLSDKERRAIDFPLELNAASAAEYTALKAQHPDTLVGFEAGGNFMFYGEDAAKVAKVLNSALFTRETALGEVQVTGFPPSLWARKSKELWSAGNNVYLAGLNEDGTHHQTKHLHKEDYLPIGSIINMDGRKFRIDGVDFDKGKVSLQDMALADLRMPIFREEPLSVVRELYEQQDEALDAAPEKAVDYKVGDDVVVDLLTRTIEGKIGYVGETDVRIDTSAQGQSWDNEVINKHQFEDGLRQVEPQLSDEELDELPISAVMDGKVQTFPDAAALDEALNAVPAGNFHITDDHLGEGGAKQKYARNIEAIRTLFKLEDEHRGATAEEQQVLSQYVGWGGLADAFAPDKDNWAKEYTVKEVRPRYSCFYKIRHPGDCDGQSGYGVSKLDSIVEEVVRQIFAQFREVSRKKLLESVKTNDAARIQKKVKKIQKDLESKQKELDDLKAETILVIRGVSALDKELLGTLVAEAREALETLEKQLVQAQEEYEEATKTAKRSNYICNELFTWADVYDTANHDERRAILQQFIAEIRVRKDYEISITLNASFNQVEQLKAASTYDGAEIFEGISEKGA